MRTEEEKHQTLIHAFEDLDALKNAYMPFVRDGGIFIPTKNAFNLGDFVNVTITLPETKRTFTFDGEVIWIKPQSLNNIQNHTGVGVQCNGDEGEALNRAIQQLFVGGKIEGENSDTM